jgi:thioredoxin-like negative regulator of GroEL
MNPRSGVDFQWLGKAWARRADTSNPVTATGYSTRAQKSFEKAIALDPHSVSALNELLDLHLERRGLAQAQAIADQLAAIDALEGLRAQERIELRRRVLRTPEEKVRMAIDSVPSELGRAATVGH